MNRYTFCRVMEYTATAHLYQDALGENPQEAYEKLEERMWEFNDEPSLYEEMGVQIEPTEIVKINKKRLDNAHLVEEKGLVRQAQLWNQASDDLEEPNE